jgi:hypothetical protein
VHQTASSVVRSALCEAFVESKLREQAVFHVRAVAAHAPYELATFEVRPGHMRSAGCQNASASIKAYWYQEDTTQRRVSMNNV